MLDAFVNISFGNVVFPGEPIHRDIQKHSRWRVYGEEPLETKDHLARRKPGRFQISTIIQHADTVPQKGPPIFITIRMIELTKLTLSK